MNIKYPLLTPSLSEFPQYESCSRIISAKGREVEFKVSESMITKLICLNLSMMVCDFDISVRCIVHADIVFSKDDIYSIDIEKITKLISIADSRMRELRSLSCNDYGRESIIYMEPMYIKTSLERLSIFIKKNCSDYPFLTAMTTLAVILAIHPLRDGNGRVSRFLFKSIIQNFVSEIGYSIPIWFVLRQNKALFIKVLQGAQFSGKWDEYYNFISSATLYAISLRNLVLRRADSESLGGGVLQFPPQAAATPARSSASGS